VILVKRFDIFVNHIVILDQLLQYAGYEIENRLPRLVLVVAVNAGYGYVLTLKEGLEMVYDDRSGVDL
jgi:hypothetical protein